MGCGVWNSSYPLRQLEFGELLAVVEKSQTAPRGAIHAVASSGNKEERRRNNGFAKPVETEPVADLYAVPGSDWAAGPWSGRLDGETGYDDR